MYSPKIREELVKRLHQLKVSRKARKSLTFYVNEAIQEYLDRLDKQGTSRS